VRYRDDQTRPPPDTIVPCATIAIAEALLPG